jgi:Tol biopolymer transport system component
MERRTSDVALLGLSALLLASCGVARAQTPDPPPPSGAAAAKAAGVADGPGKAAGQLVEQLERHPAKPSTAANRAGGLFLLNLATRRVTMIADEPDPGDSYCGSPAWSNDGRRILFDAMKSDQAGRAHLKVLEVIEGRLTMTDLGIGNCPTFSPDDRRIAFLYNPGPPVGVWVMHADGSERRPLGSYGRPRWSLDGHQMMITGFSIPYRVTIMDVDPEKSGQLVIPGNQIFSVPSWVADRTLIVVIGSNDTIALIDTSTPSEARVKEVLWKKGKGLDVTLSYPGYSPATQEYVFVGEGPKGMALYAFRKGQPDPPRRLKPEGFDKLLRDPTFSPDGRFLIFTSDRCAPQQREAAPPPKAGPRVESRRTP